VFDIVCVGAESDGVVAFRWATAEDDDDGRFLRGEEVEAGMR
jgi:hypothetical protein